MADKRSLKETPPPLDPFPTYQSPYPRPPSESEENPFIAFRRFADSQISSLLSSVAGFPAIFAETPASGRFANIEAEMTRRRQELEEGWRKQWEQEREEGRQESEKANEGASPWTALPTAPRKDQDNDAGKQQGLTEINDFVSGIVKMIEDIEKPLSQEFSRIMKEIDQKSKKPRRKQDEKCPVLQEAGTELDMYESAFKRAMEKDKKHEMKCKRDGFDSRANGWLSGVGWDGKQKRKTKEQTPKTDNGEERSSETTTHSFKTTRRYDPVSNPDQTLPWLLTSPYSPVYISNPSQPRLAKVDMVDEPMVPFQIFSPLFAERYQHPVAEELARKLSWADAFEDLVSLEQTGRMVERNHSTWRTPSTWIHDMVARGSLGPRWGFDDQHRLMKKDLSASIEAWPTADDVQSAMKRVKDTQAVTPTTAEKPENAEAPLPEHRHMQGETMAVEAAQQENLPVGWERKEGANGRPYYADHNTWTTGWDLPSSVPSVGKELAMIQPLDEAQDTSDSSAFWSSTSASSWSSTTQDSPDSIVSTLTTTDTRTLPDGSVETKRILRKRFADGREESNETVEVKNAPVPSPEPRSVAQTARQDSKILKELARVQEDKQTQTPAQAPETPKKGGWFWK